MGRVLSVMYRLAILWAFLLVTPAPIHAKQTPAAPGACSASHTLTLEPGFINPDTQVRGPSAPDIPPEPLVIQVPLYPGASPSALPMPEAAYGVPASRYLKSATAEFLLPTDWDTASAWYRQAFLACGYADAGHGSSGRLGTVISVSLDFSDPRRSPLQVTLVFEHAPSGGTLALYVATTITYPPPATLVPGAPDAVAILAYRSLAQGPLALRGRVVVHDVQSIQELTHHLNNLPPVDVIISCPWDDGSHDVLRFSYPDGHELTVDVGVRGCRIVKAGDRAARVARDQALFDLLDALLARPSAVHPGWPFDARTLRLSSRQPQTHDGAARFVGWLSAGNRYLYLDHGALWLDDLSDHALQQIAPGPIAQVVADPAGAILYRPLVQGAPGPLKLVSYRSMDRRPQLVGWAPRAAMVGTQAGMGDNVWSNELVLCEMHVWFVQKRRLVGIDAHYRSNTYRPDLELPPLTPSTRLAVSCDGLLAAIAIPARGLEIREVQTGKLVRHLRPATPISALSWSTDDRTLAYATSGPSGVLADVDVKTGRQHLLKRLGGGIIAGITWDPYGHALAFAARTRRPGGRGELEVVDSNGSGLRSLDGGQGGSPVMPVWSWRGGIIGYTRVTGAAAGRSRTDVWLDYLSTPNPDPAAALLSWTPQVELHAAAAPPRVLRVREATGLCRAHPAGQYRRWLQGWFIPRILASGYVEGGLFDSRRAVPAVTVDRWDVSGHWKRYGAIYVHIGTQASFGPRRLTLHGRLDCASFRFWSDRDPFAPAQLKPVHGTAQQGQNGSVTTWASASGVKLTLTVPRQVYPRGALARVWVSLQNVSRHDVGYWTTGVSLPGFASPQAEVLDRSGNVVFPPAMPYMPPLPGPPPTLVPLHPGQAVGFGEYIVVRGARIRASQRFVPHLLRNLMPAASTIATRPITVRLTAEPPPQLLLHRPPQGLAVDVVRPGNASGRMLMLEYADCGAPIDISYSYSWVPAGLHLTPGCSPVRAWHLRVAWLNHPVASIDYSSDG